MMMFCMQIDESALQHKEMHGLPRSRWSLAMTGYYDRHCEKPGSAWESSTKQSSALLVAPLPQPLGLASGLPRSCWSLAMTGYYDRHCEKPGSAWESSTKQSSALLVAPLLRPLGLASGLPRSLRLKSEGHQLAMNRAQRSRKLFRVTVINPSLRDARLRVGVFDEAIQRLSRCSVTLIPGPSIWIAALPLVARNDVEHLFAPLPRPLGLASGLPRSRWSLAMTNEHERHCEKPGSEWKSSTKQSRSCINPYLHQKRHTPWN